VGKRRVLACARRVIACTMRVLACTRRVLSCTKRVLACTRCVLACKAVDQDVRRCYCDWRSAVRGHFTKYSVLILEELCQVCISLNASPTA
jgi:hypothetical protein